MSDDDLIRRGDVRAALRNVDAWNMANASAIAALPAVTLTPKSVDDSLAADPVAKPEMVSFSLGVTDQLMAEVAKGPQGHFLMQPTLADPAYTYAKHLAETIFARAKFDVPEWKVLDDTEGVLTQIDHMVAVLFDRADLADTATWNAAIHKAAAIADSRVEAYGAKMRAATDKKEKRDWQSMLFAAVDIEHAILALLKEEKP